jgi:dephospho-CoA kinase
VSGGISPAGAKLVIGVIGGIGAGKSQVAAALGRLGGAVIAGDQLGHQALRIADAKAAVIARFGQAIVAGDGEIDRKKLGSIVFSEPGLLKDLEAIVFPWIKQQLRQALDVAFDNAAARFVVVDAAVMLEAGWNNYCDKVVYVHAPRDQRLARLARQRGWSEKEVLARERTQLSLTEKVTRADAAIDNSGAPGLVDDQAEELVKRWFFAVAS